MGEDVRTHLEVFVGRFLVFSGHGVWGVALGEVTSTTEEDASSANAEQGVEEDLSTLTWRRKGTGTVRTESNPVC